MTDTTETPHPSGYFPCFVNHCKGRFVRRSGPHGVFYGCSQYPNCTATRSRDSVESEFTAVVIGEIDLDEVG